MNGSKGQLSSKINITQIVSFVATILVVFNIDLPSEIQVQIVAVIQGSQAIITWVLRTWFTSRHVDAKKII